MAAWGWRTAAAASASAVIMMALGVPPAPVLLGVGLACGVLWWRSEGSR